VHRNTYGRLERGDSVEVVPTCPSVLPLLQNEICFLLRRRSEWTQQECADNMGITRYWYNLMENGRVNSDPLMEYWNER
jgi:DNA-binding XRE family transcriptional regulator